MKGDFTRWTFDASKRYSSVRLQQGRVLLDADWNEQLDIIAYTEQTGNQEIIGLNGVPDLDSFDVGFGENGDNSKIKLDQGRCYVEGILCENLQNDYELEITEIPGIDEENNTLTDYLVYLEVWQHHITAVEEPDLLEPALGGPDTTTRTQTYWRLKAEKLDQKTTWRKEWDTLLSSNREKGKLKVESGTELPNDLYRVEIHEVTSEETTFKWARNNASMAARVEKIEPHAVTIIKNTQIQFQDEQGKQWWIEITHEELVKAGEPGLFLKVNNVEDDNTLLIIDPDSDDWSDEIINWDQEYEIITVRIWEANARTIKFQDDQEDTQKLIELEKGLKVNFVDAEVDGKYTTGDYWLIPTRSQETVEWSTEGKKPDGIWYHYCPLAIVEYDETAWSVKQDCREVFPALTEIARETKLAHGRELSIGVHSYNDARRADTKNDHVDDQLNIQGGEQLTLNAGYWKDDLDGDLPETDSSIIFSINEEEVMCLGKDNLEIADGKNLIVDGTSHLKGVVAIGPQEPNQNIGLLVQPELINSSEDEVVGEKLAPTLRANSEGQTLTALHIQPTFNNGSHHPTKYGLIVENGKVLIGRKKEPQNGLDIGVDLRPKVEAINTEDKLVGLRIKPHFHNERQGEVSHYGLVVERGKVGIGSKTLDTDIPNYQIGVDVRPVVHASDSEDKLVGLYIHPEFKGDCTCGITDEAKYGLIVEDWRVAFGPKIGEEYLVDIGRDTDGGEPRLKVAGDLEVYGKVTFHADPSEPGDVELGQQNEDQVKIYGKLETLHTSGKLKVASPLEIQLEEDGTQDFLSLFAANDETNDVDGRIVWKKGTVTNPSEDPEYEEQAKEVAAIYSSTIGNGTSDTTGDLRFGTSSSLDDDIQDRMVITADGKVGIGTENPESELEVTGTSTLETLVVNTKLEVPAGANTEIDALKLTGTGTRTKPILTIPSGNVCIGADEIPQSNLVNGKDVRLYVKGSGNQLVSFDTNLSVLGSTDVETLTVTPELVATENDEILTAATIEPTFTLEPYTGVKTLALRIVSGDVDLETGNLNIKSGKLVFGNSSSSTNDKFRVTGGSTLLEGDLEVSNGTNVALKVNQATQEVGIGTPSLPGYKLAVAGNTKLAGKLEVVAPSINGVGNAVEIKPIFTGNGTQTAVRIDPTFAGNGRLKFGLHVVKENVALCSSSGGVAIGSSNPDGHKLRVTGGTTYLESGLTVNSGGVTLTSGDVSLTQGNLTLTSGNATITQGNLTLTSGNATITQGNLAIGSILSQDLIPLSPGDEAPLHVFKYDAGTNNLLEIARFERVCEDATTLAEAQGGYIGLYLYDNNDNSGNPSRIEGARISWRFDNAANDERSGSLGFWTSQGPQGGTSTLTEQMTITRDGNVGIGTTNPQAKLQVDGIIRTTGDVLTSSDLTLKDNIETLKDGLSKILGLRGVSYQWKDKRKTAREAQIGLVAQEVEKVFPELVSTDSQGIKSMSYSKLIAPLIEAIKEQQGQISELVNQVQQQQTQINKLQARKK